MSDCCQDNPPCPNCGPCADCVEPKVIAVKRLESILPCDVIDATIKDIFNSGFAKDCSLKITEFIVSGSTVVVVPSIESSALEYSSDGVLFQDSPAFTGQKCGTRRYLVRDRSFPACLAGKSLTLTTDCVCNPNPQPVSPVETECIAGFTHIKTFDGCGNYGWSKTDAPCTGGCVPGPYVDMVPQQTRCENGFTEIRQSDGCNNYKYRTTNEVCGTCINPTVPSAQVVQATCNLQGVIQNDASFSIAGIANADRYAYSLGSTYNGPSYAGATPLPGNNTVNVAGLNGSASPTTYVARFFNGTDGCVTDRTIVVPGKDCQVPCNFPTGILSKTDPTCNAGVGTGGSLSFMNHTNVTRWQLCENITFNCTPNYATATPVTGSGSFVVKSGINFANGEQFKHYVLRLFNNSEQCFVDSSFTFVNPCYTGPVCDSPTLNTPVVTAATCSGTTPNNNATIAISGIQNATKVGYSIGNTYTGPNFASAATIANGAFNLNGLAGSSSSTQYVFRFFNGSDNCKVDVPVTLPGVTCQQPCILPSSNAGVGVAPTCGAGTSINNDASFSIGNLANATHYAYSVGSSYTGGGFDQAIPVSAGSITVTGLNGSATATNYSVRIWNGSADCFITLLVNVPGKTCQATCVVPVFTLTSTAPTGCNGEASTNDGKVTISQISNGNKWQICIAETFNCTPNYDGLNSFSGSGPIDIITNLGFLANQSSKTIWVRMYNQAETCFTDHSIVVNNPCVSCCAMTIGSIELTNI